MDRSFCMVNIAQRKRRGDLHLVMKKKKQEEKTNIQYESMAFVHRVRHTKHLDTLFFILYKEGWYRS